MASPPRELALVTAASATAAAIGLLATRDLPAASAAALPLGVGGVALAVLLLLLAARAREDEGRGTAASFARHGLIALATLAGAGLVLVVASALRGAPGLVSAVLAQALL